MHAILLLFLDFCVQLYHACIQLGPLLLQLINFALQLSGFLACDRRSSGDLNEIRPQCAKPLFCRLCFGFGNLPLGSACLNIRVESDHIPFQFQHATAEGLLLSEEIFQFGYLASEFRGLVRKSLVVLRQFVDLVNKAASLSKFCLNMLKFGHLFCEVPRRVRISCSGLFSFFADCMDFLAPVF